MAKRIGILKISSEVDIRQPEVEKKVIDRIEDKAKELGILPEAMKDIFFRLMEISTEEQELLKESKKEQKTNGKCVIYGGAGGIGRLLCELMIAKGYEPIIVRSSGKFLAYPAMKEAEIGPAEPSFVIVSVQMRVTGEVIEKAASAFPGKTIYEICSMKDHIRPSISRADKKGSKVISLHPMFGPNIRSFRKLPVIFCGNEGEFENDPIWEAFNEQGSTLMTVPFDQHDEMMSYILQLTHAINIIYFTVLSNSKIQITNLESAASPICRKQLLNAENVAVQDPDLYFEIQKLSGHLGKLYEELGAAQGELVEALASDSSSKFRRLMEKGRKYFERR